MIFLVAVVAKKMLQLVDLDRNNHSRSQILNLTAVVEVVGPVGPSYLLPLAVVELVAHLHSYCVLHTDYWIPNRYYSCLCSSLRGMKVGGEEALLRRVDRRVRLVSPIGISWYRCLRRTIRCIGLVGEVSGGVVEWVGE